MAMKSRPYVPPAGRGGGALPDAVVKDLMALYQAGRWDQLEMKASAAVKRHPDQPFGWKALAKALIFMGKWPQALAPLTRLAKLAPLDPDAHNDLGTALNTLGRKDEAEASYRRALALNPGFAMTHSNLGVLLAEQFRFAEALLEFGQSLALDPAAASTHNSLGKVLDDSGRRKEAEASYRRALELQPDLFEAWVNLGGTLKALQRLGESEACLRQALALRPDSAHALHLLGSLLEVIPGRAPEAMACLERVIALAPGNVDAYCTLGNILLRTGEAARAVAMFRHAKALRPLITWPARRERPEFSAVFLDSPGPGSTPVTYLAGQAPYDAHFYCVLPGEEPDLDFLRDKAGVVVNMIADADNGAEILPCVQKVVAFLGRPTVNPPAVVLGTDRETIARRLADLPLCRIPRTLRLTGPELLAAGADWMDGLDLPVLVRLAGNHGGDDFEKLDDVAGILAFASRRPEASYYLAEYVDYRSQDDLFRKYRWIAIDGVILPYHLAIHDDWKVHHFRTDMANQAWMRQEEAAFLEHPEQVFDEAHQSALRAVAAATGLDYCGIDCALDPEGRIVVFETNAAMLVHDEKDDLFAYKNPCIARIKVAFDGMLRRMALA